MHLYKNNSCTYIPQAQNSLRIHVAVTLVKACLSRCLKSAVPCNCRLSPFLVGSSYIDRMVVEISACQNFKRNFTLSLGHSASREVLNTSSWLQYTCICSNEISTISHLIHYSSFSGHSRRRLTTARIMVEKTIIHTRIRLTPMAVPMICMISEPTLLPIASVAVV